MKKLSLLYVFILLVGGGGCRHEAVAPAGCEFSVQKPLANDSHTYQFDVANRLSQVLVRTSRNDAVYQYTYQEQQVMVTVTYPGIDYQRIQYDVTLNERGHAITAQETIYQRQVDGTFEGKLRSSHKFSYDAEGYLTSHQDDEFMYPIGAAGTTETYRQDIQYAVGNPVLITYSKTVAGVVRESGTISNRYGTQTNLVRIPLLLETDQSSFLTSSLQPLLGNPPASLITFSKVMGGQKADSTRFIYQSDAKGQLLEATRQPGALNVFDYKPFTYTFKNSCD